MYEAYRPALLRKAQRMLRSRAAAEDVVQGLFVDLLAKRTETHDLPYLFRAISNRCLNALRDDRRRSELLLRRIEPVTFCAREANGVIALDVLAKLVTTLPSEVSEALVYAHLDDMTQDEIANVMGLSRKTIGKYLSEAEATLKGLVAT